MKIISIILILCLIQVSLCAYLDYGSESALVDSSNNSEDEDSVGDRQPDNPMITKLKLQADSDADLDDEDESNGDGLVNQDDDNEPDMPKVDATQAPPELQPQPPVANQPDIAGQPSRGYPGINEPAPQTPDYSAYANRVYECHSGQYQCQKVEASAPTRCIPNEWRCNGVRDCENNDDESSCSASGGTGPRTDIKCSPEQYKCHGGACIERQYVCDGTYHCTYGDDEANCQTPQTSLRDYSNRQDRPAYPNYPYHITRRYEATPGASDQTTANRGSASDTASRDIYTRPQPQPQSDRKSEEYVQRLEWRDRCFRSCLKY